MSPKEARELLPVFQAYAEGKTIQRRNVHNAWVDVSNPNFSLAPEEYRIKPEAVCGWVNCYRGDVGGGYAFSWYPTKEEADAATVGLRMACIPITFKDGEGL